MLNLFSSAFNVIWDRYKPFQLTRKHTSAFLIIPNHLKLQHAVFWLQQELNKPKVMPPGMIKVTPCTTNTGNVNKWKGGMKQSEGLKAW